MDTRTPYQRPTDIIIPISKASDPYTCCECGETKPAHAFTMLLIAPANKRRPEWRRKVMCVSRPCSVCRARTRSREATAKLRAQAEALRASVVAKHIELGNDVPAHLIPMPERIVKGGDPVLRACADGIAATMQRVREFRKKERVAGLLTVSNEEADEGVTLSKEAQELKRSVNIDPNILHMLSCRLSIYHKVRRLRMRDLQHPLLVNDPTRMHLLAYVPRHVQDWMDQLAEIVNTTRVLRDGRGKPWVGLPQYKTRLPDTGRAGISKDASDMSVREEVVRKSWAEYLDNVTYTQRLASEAIRSRTARKRHRPMRLFKVDRMGERDLDLPLGTFTMQDFHEKRQVCARAALKTIERAIDDGKMPAEWYPHEQQHGNDWDDPYYNAPPSSWKWLVPPLARAELEAMWWCMDPRIRATTLAFPKRASRVLGKRTKYQIAHRLGPYNVPMPDPPPALQRTEFDE